MNADDLRIHRIEELQLRERGSYERYRERHCISEQILQRELNAIAKEVEQVKNFGDEVVFVGHGYGDRPFHASARCGSLTRRDRATRLEEHFLEEVSGRLSPCKRCYPAGMESITRSA